MANCSCSAGDAAFHTASAPLTWLITGGCGFIGTAFIRCLLENRPGDQIRVLDNLECGSREDLARVCGFQEAAWPGFGSSVQSSSPVFSDQFSTHCSSKAVKLLVGDIKDPQACQLAAQGVDVIVHLAANTGVGPSVENPVADMQANVLGIVNMLEAARQNDDLRFIFASSGAPVGEIEPPVHEELAPHPVSPYGASKLAGEGYCSAYYQTFGVKTVTLRFGNVYGPGSTHKSSVVARFIRQAMQGETCEIFGDGSQTRDFIYIQDLIEAILKAALFPGSAKSSLFAPWGQIFQIATSKEHTVNEVAEKIGPVLEEKKVAMQIKYAQARLGDVKRNYSDTRKAKDKLGWQAKTPLETGIQKTVDWFCSQKSKIE